MNLKVNRFNHPEEFEKLLGIAPFCTLHCIKADIKIVPDEEDTPEAFKRFVKQMESDLSIVPDPFPLIHWVIL